MTMTRNLNVVMEYTIVDAWSANDIIEYAKSTLKKQLTKEDCIAILQLMEDNFDANIGYNWNQVNYWTKDFTEGR